MRTEVGAIFRDRDQQARGPSTERAVAASERETDPLADAYSSFRRRARGEEPRPSNREGDRE